MKCIIVSGEASCRETLSHFILRTPHLQLAFETESAFAAKRFLKSNKVDLIFLDVEIKDSSCFAFIKTISNNAQIILTSETKEHAVEAIEFDLAYFLPKPFDYENFKKAVQRARLKLEIEEKYREEKSLFIKTDARIVKISYDDIQFIEAMADYMMIYTKDGRYILHSTMKALAEKLPQHSFIRVHRSYIINIKNISSLKDHNVFIQAKPIPIGATYKENLISRIPVLN